MDWYTISVAAIIGIICVAIIVKAIINKKNHKSCCSGCAGCAYKDKCHSAK